MPNMVSDSLNEIQALNRAYLELAQRILREDQAAGATRLGVSASIADALVQLSASEIVALSRSMQLLLRFHFDDKTVLSTLGDKIGRPAKSVGSNEIECVADTKTSE